MNVLLTLQYLKNDIKVVVWDNDIDRIEYNDTETFRPTAEEITAVDQSAVEAWDAVNRAQQKQQSISDVQAQLAQLQQQLSILAGE